MPRKTQPFAEGNFLEVHSTSELEHAYGDTTTDDTPAHYTHTHARMHTHTHTHTVTEEWDTVQHQSSVVSAHLVLCSYIAHYKTPVIVELE